MKKTLLFITMLIISVFASAQNTTKLRIDGVEKNGGKIYLSIFNNEPSFKSREAYQYFILDSSNEIVTKDINLPKGHYVISIYQDSNGNGKLDTNLIGIPKEKFGFTNYDGKSAPGSFNRHKVEIDEKVDEIVVGLYKI
jgi:uncharacterized protein (DUF2141 family)